VIVRSWKYEIATAVGELGYLDVVCINAGVASMGSLLELDADAWDDVISVNLTGPFNTVQAAVPHVVSGGRGGSIIFTSSVMGLDVAPQLGHYVASKHGLLGLMKTLAVELGSKFIRVNAVLPTNVDTKMLQNDTVRKVFMPHLDNPARADAESDNSVYRTVNAIPIPWVDPIDVSNAVLFLASEEARFVTGIAMPVDAGFLIV
jgi:NAD(P)-dependent dehydrogenase (short-subunit alcohol dehydrogenase family)